MKKQILSAAMSLLLTVSLPMTVFAEEYDLEKGSIEVTASDDGNQYVSQTANNITNEKQMTETVITQKDSTTVTQNTVVITAGSGQTAKVTLKDVNIDVSGTGDWFTSGSAAVSTEGVGHVIIELEGENTVKSGGNRAGLEKNNSGSLTINDADNDGSLDATGGVYGAGIGSGYDKDGREITITGGTINAQGGVYGAGIGSGYDKDGREITITGGTINAQGGEGGAGIGGGRAGSGSDIAITGGKVNATGGYDGAGIGGGTQGEGSNITISDSEVTARGSGCGAGIGGGHGRASTSISVTGNAQVKTQGGEYGIAIGGGSSKNGSLHLGAEVTPDTSGLGDEGTIEYYAPGKEMTEATLDKTLGHTHHWDAGVVTTQPTCTGKGVRTYTCQDGNNFTKTEDLDALDHSFAGQQYVSDNNATCRQDGTKSAQCVRYDQCGVTHTVPDEGSRLSHTVVIDKAVAPTYTSMGLTEGSHCSMCNEIFTAQESIPMLVQLTTETEEASMQIESAAQAPLYRVTDQEGRDISCKAERKDGVLTVTADADLAILTGTIGGISTLRAQGVEKLVFVTKSAKSTFSLADLLGKGSHSEGYKLTHDGKIITFILGEKLTDVRDILEKA